MAKREMMIACRERAGLTRTEVGSKLMYAEPTIRNIEYGFLYTAGWTTQKKKMWLQLAHLYGCKPEDLGE